MKHCWIQYSTYLPVKIQTTDCADVADLIEKTKLKLQNLLRDYDVAQLMLVLNGSRVRIGMDMKPFMKMITGNSDVNPVKLVVIDVFESMGDLSVKTVAEDKRKTFGTTTIVEASMNSTSSAESSSATESSSSDDEDETPIAKAVKDSEISLATSSVYDIDENNEEQDSINNSDNGSLDSISEKSHNTSSTDTSSESENAASSSSESDKSTSSSSSVQDVGSESGSSSSSEHELAEAVSAESMKIELVDTDPYEIGEDGWSQHSFHNYITGTKKRK